MSTRPKSGGYESITTAATALLTLSDAICERAGLQRYQIGGEAKQSVLTVDLVLRARRAVSHLSFTHDELNELGILPNHLEPFILDGWDPTILSDDFGRTILERHPIVRTGNGIAVVLPTAISTALRFFVVGTSQAAGLGEPLARALAQTHAKALERNRVMGGRDMQDLPFMKTKGALIGATVAEVDPGRYLQTILVIDDLAGFADTGLTEPNPHADDVLNAIESFVVEGISETIKRPDFREGLVLVVMGGAGRAAFMGFRDPPDPRWDIRGISAPDVETLDSLDRVTALTLFRLSRAEALLEDHGAELQNINGLLNLVGWMRQLDGHLIPHGVLEDGFLDGGGAVIIWVDQTAIRTLREEAARRRDRHLQRTVDGAWVTVQKTPPTIFPEDHAKPHYFAEELPPRGVFLTERRAWWCRSEVPPNTQPRLAYERWRVVDLWMSRAAPVLERAFPELPAGPIEWTAIFEAELSDRSEDCDAMPFEVARSLVAARTAPDEKRITTSCRPEWESAHAQPENIAERALVDGLVRAVAQYAGASLNDDERELIVDSIVRSPLARQQHGFRAASYRDMLQSRLPNPVVIEREDDAGARLGLGWKVHDRASGAWIEGKTECVAFLNRLVTHLEDELLEHVRTFNRKSLLEALLINHEAAARDLSQWNLTAASSLALHDDHEAAHEAIMEWSAKLNAVTLTTRILLEVAVCEAGESNGPKPGDLDLCRMMALAAMIFHFGGDSDAIRWGVMEPKLRITPFGDIHANHEFSDTVIVPFGKMTSAKRLREAVASYPLNVLGESSRAGDQSTRGDFASAVEEAFGAPLEAIALFVSHLEHLGLKVCEPTVSISRKVLLQDLADAGVQRAPELMETLTLRPRASWRATPLGFESKDRHPWRFRRRLSVLRRPILALDNSNDPELLLAPGLVREALDYSLTNYHRGTFPEQQLGPLMRAWKARTDGQHGAFAREVGAALTEAGWKVEIDVPVAKVVGAKLDRDYGDVDVLAWHPKSTRVLLIECKDVQFRKTFGEVAEQLADYRGEERNGKPDKLRRHLDRIHVMSQHLPQLKNYTRLPWAPVIEGHLVFRDPVPMTFVLDRIRDRTSVLTMGDIGEIAPPI